MIQLPVRQQSPPGRLPHAPVRTVMVYLTEDCNLRCSYCFVHKRPRRMSAQTAERVVDFLLRRDLAPTEEAIQVNFFGGEPFLELDRMEQILDGCRRGKPNARRAFQFSATTNGTIWNDRVGRIVSDHRMVLLVSLDGGPSTTAADRPFASGRSPHDLIVSNLGHLKEVAHDLLVRATFTPDGLDLPERVQALMDIGAPAVALFPVQECAWEHALPEVDRAYERLGQWFLEHSTPDSLPPLVVTRKLLLEWHRHLKTGSRPPRPCPVGHSLLGIDPEGQVMPCHRFLDRRQDHLGTLEEPGLRSEARRPYLALGSETLADCSGCPAAGVCGGGCRLVPLQKGHELHQVDPAYCIPMRAHHRAVVALYDELARRGWLRSALTFPNSWSRYLQHTQ